MTTRRTTSHKRERERAKQAKAAAKRERRQDRSNDAADATSTPYGDSSSTEQLLQRVATLQERFDTGTITFDEYEVQKTELLQRVAAQALD